MQGHKLRLALLSDSHGLPAWAVEALRLVLETEGLSFQLMVSLNHQPTATADGWLGRYLRLEERLFSAEPNAFLRRDISGLRDLLPIVNAQATVHKATMHKTTVHEASFELDELTLAKLREARLDVIVYLGALRPSAEVLEVAKFGLWRYDFAVTASHSATSLAVREVLKAEPTVHTALIQVRNNPQDDRLLFSSSSKTDYLSILRTRQVVCWKSAGFLKRALLTLQHHGEDWLESQPPIAATPNTHVPSVMTVLQHWGRYAGFKLQTYLRREDWILLYASGNTADSDLASFQALTPPSDRFWADPFVIGREGKHYIYFEELPYSSNKGHISLLVMNEDGSFERPQVVLERPYHLSYPFLLEHEGELYMIPESAANRSVDAFRCSSFPDVWEHHSTLMQNASLFDSTLLEHEGKWWLFANATPREGMSDWDELYLYYADSPLAENWTPHPLNPIVSDIASSRPAGAIFKQSDKLLRPAQDSSEGYGYALKFQEIITLSETAYEEKTLVHIRPDWNRSITGVHSFNHADNLTVADAKRLRRR